MLKSLLTTTAFLGLMAGPAFAGVISATVYEKYPGLPANPPAVSGLPSAQFTTNNINYFTGDSPTTSIATFFNSPTFTNTTNGFNSADSFSNTLTVFTGSTFLKAGTNSFVVGHDDGVLLYVSGSLVVDAPQDTGFNTTPFEVSAAAAGIVPFSLYFHENSGGPSGIDFQINGAPVGVPEPASLALLAAGMVGLAFVRRRQA